MINKGCIYHLVRVTDTDAEAPTLESEPVVNEFLEVFPDEVPRIPPDREIDFRIDVMPGMQPMFILPYRMAPAELMELKEQLKDLLEKGFIRLSKAVKFQWSDACERSFQEFKSILTMTLVLTLPEGTDGFVKELNLRQRRWLELLKDYDIDTLYHPEKANVVVDALSQKSIDILAHLEAYQRPLANKVHWLASLGVRLADSSDEGLHVTPVSIIYDRGKHFTAKVWKKFQQGLGTQGSWDDHLPLIEFFYYNSYHANIQMTPFEALYRRTCRSPIGWFEIGEAELIGPNLVHQAMEKVKTIKERLETTQSHQNSYSDIRRKDLEFKEDDWVFLKVSPMKGIMWFGKKGKLCPRYVGPYKIIQRISQVDYRLELPLEMSLVHPLFHVSMLKKMIGDSSLIVLVETIEVNEELTYEEILVAILDRQVRKLRKKEIASVKVLWWNQLAEEATWKTDEEMKKYHNLFE
ncbi:uncharacterized protein [Nicotiana tomentosiformis]|uniref:uncharacterized protein n=1 Tax=Nicotiana tomentosiformis TaxID=4098 RepID=UPI00388C8483